MSIASITAAQRVEVRDACLSAAYAMQRFAQSATTPRDDEAAEVSSFLNEAATALQVASAVPEVRILDRVISATGDSRCANGFSGAAPALVLEVYGWAPQAAVLSDGRARVTHARNHGVGGDTTAMWLARVPAMLAAGGDVFITLIGTNDRGSANMTLAESKANILAGLKMFADAGKAVVIVAETPRGGANALVGTQLANHLALRQWIKSDLPALGYKVADPWPELIDPAQVAAGLPLAGYFHDGLHPGPIAARIIGKHVAQALVGLLGAPLALPTVASPVDSLTPVPLLTGTNGTISGSANATGSMATSTVLTGSSWTGATAVAAKAPSPEVGEYQLVTLGGTPTLTAPFLTVHQVANLTGVPAGTTIKGVGYIEYSGLAGVAGVALEVMFVRPVGGTQYVKCLDRYTEANPLNSSLVQGRYETPDLVLDGTETEVRVRVAIYAVQNVALAGTIKIGQMMAVKV